MLGYPPGSRHPPGADIPQEQTLPSRHPSGADAPPEETPPRSRHTQEQTALGVDTSPKETPSPPGSRHPPPQEQTHIPQRRHPQEQTPPGTDTHPRSRHPLEADTPQEETPREETLAYGQRAASTHPTGMYSC